MAVRSDQLALVDVSGSGALVVITPYFVPPGKRTIVKDLRLTVIGAGGSQFLVSIVDGITGDRVRIAAPAVGPQGLITSVQGFMVMNEDDYIEMAYNGLATASFQLLASGAELQLP